MSTWKNLMLAGTMVATSWLLPVRLLALDCVNPYEACLGRAQGYYNQCIDNCDPATSDCESFCEQVYNNFSCNCDVSYAKCEGMLQPTCEGFS